MAGDESDHLQRRRKIRLPTRCRRHREHHHERRSGSTSLERKAQSRCADSDFWRHGAGVDWPVGGSFDSGTHPSAGSTGERRLHEVLLLPSSSQAQRCCQCGTTGNRPKSISSTILGTAVRILGTKRPEPEGSGQHDRNTIGHWAFAILATAGDLGLSVASALFGVYLLSGFTEVFLARWPVLATFPTRSVRSCSKRFRCGRTPTPRWASQPSDFVVIPTLCVTAESRNGPDGRSPAQGMSQNYIWHSRCIASSCS